MNCPRCGAQIGGYVTAGSVEASRVAKGLCPHCGRSMPSGYKVGYASSFAPPPPKKYDLIAIRILNGKTKLKCLLTILNGIVASVFVALADGIGAGVACVVLFLMLALICYLAWPALVRAAANAQFVEPWKPQPAKRETTESPIGSSALIFSFIVSLIFAVVTFFVKAPGVLRLLLIIGAYALLFALQFRTWKRNYKWALGEASRARKALELYEMMQKNGL